MPNQNKSSKRQRSSKASAGQRRSSKSVKLTELQKILLGGGVLATIGEKSSNGKLAKPSREERKRSKHKVA